MVAPVVFLNWLRLAIDSVGPGYFGFVERVYCYELYHFIRVEMTKYERQPKRKLDVYLHSEFVKVVISGQRAQELGVVPLGATRSPDFILHDPSNADHQIAAVEVKAAQDLSYKDFMDDVNKLSALKEKYRFELVVFHCVNVNMSLISKHLKRARGDGLTLDGEILVIVKSSHSAVIEEEYIRDIR
jgi:hypothetical protein